MATWRIRGTMAEIDVERRYAGHPTIFSIVLNHGGEFTKFPGRKYINGKKNFVDLMDSDTFSVHDIDVLMEAFGYVEEAEEGTPLYYHFKRPFGDLDFGLFALACDEDVRHLASYVARNKLIEVFIEHGKTELHTYRMSPTRTNVRLREYVEPPSTRRRLLLSDKPHNELDDALLSDGKKDRSNNVTEVGETSGVEIGDKNGDDLLDNNEADGEMSDGEMSGGDMSDSSDGDSSYSEYFYDEDNIVDDVFVDMNDFYENVDMDAEWVGDQSNVATEEEQPEVEVEVLDNEILLSGSSSDEGPGTQRKKCIKSIRRAYENDNAIVADPFYLYQTFTSAKKFKDKVNLHAIETRRKLEFEKNDKNRVRVVCKGRIPSLGNIEESGPSQQAVNKEDVKTCPWTLYASKWEKDKDWMVKTYNKEHRCLQTRKVKACDYKFLAKEIAVQVESNPTIPVQSLLEQLERKYQLGFSFMKIFRAKTAALHLVRGDYGGQYNLLRDYALELQKSNPNTTIKIDVESEANPNSETRTFKRIYICLGPLKRGFAACQRDLLGLDGSFMKGPYPGHILTAVGLDGNNGTYPVAYAVAYVPIGRPKKKRRKSAVEIESLVKGQRVSRAHKTVTCSKCHTSGHNARSCKGQNAGGPQNNTAAVGRPKRKAAPVGRPKKKVAPVGRPKKKAAGVNKEK